MQQLIVSTRFKLFLVTLLLCGANLARATPDVGQIIESSAAGIVNVQAIQWVKIKVPDQYKGVTRDPVYQVFSRMFSDGDARTPSSSDASPIIKKKTQGSGFIISSNGMIATNYHTIVGAHEVYVQLHDNRRLKASVLRTEPKRDLAIIKIAGNFVALPMANEATDGEWVLAIGAKKNGASSGTIIKSTTENTSKSLISDVIISSSNSGGPLLNTQGEVLAMNSDLLIAPMGLTRHIVVGKLIKNKDIKTAASTPTGSTLGFTAANLSEKQLTSLGLNDATGAWVKAVNVGGIAARAGLRVNDVIVGLESEKVVDTSDLSALRDFLNQGSEANLTILRNGEQKSIRFTDTRTSRNDTESPSAWNKLGLKVKTLNATQKIAANVSAGVQVTQVQDSAITAGIEVGDILVSINKQDIRTSEQLNSIASQLNSDESAIFYIVRGASRQFIGVEIAD